MWTYDQLRDHNRTDYENRRRDVVDACVVRDVSSSQRKQGASADAVNDAVSSVVEANVTESHANVSVCYGAREDEAENTAKVSVLGRDENFLRLERDAYKSVAEDTVENAASEIFLLAQHEK